MKKLYTILAFGFLFTLGEKGFSQSAFEFNDGDSITYGDTLAFGDLEVHNGFIRNKTAATIQVDVVRVQDVNLATGWKSYFCTDGQCFADFVDSVRVTLTAYDTTEFLPHFQTTALPDSQTILVSVRLVGTPTDVRYERFYGVTKIGYGAGIFEYANLAKVNIYPSPIAAGNNFNLKITNLKIQNKDLSLVVYNMHGSLVKTITDLHDGNNTLNLDLATGMYSYSLIAGEVMVNAGNFSVVK